MTSAPCQFGELHRRDADAVGGAVDQHLLAGRKPAALNQCVIGGHVGVAEHRGLFEAEPGRHRVAICLPGVDQLGQCAELGAADYFVAGLEPAHCGADRNDFAALRLGGETAPADGAATLTAFTVAAITRVVPLLPKPPRS